MTTTTVVDSSSGRMVVLFESEFSYYCGIKPFVCFRIVSGLLEASYIVTKTFLLFNNAIFCVFICMSSEKRKTKDKGVKPNACFGVC